jgi:hypothetical protein
MSAALTFPDRQRFRQVLAEMAEKAKAKLPESNGRVEKAVALVLNGDIAYDPQTGTALVNSCSDATKVYRVRGKVCECPDYERAPQGLCKHVTGLMLLVRTEQALASETPQEPALTLTQPLPEAPASINFKAMIGGFETQITLRDHDEVRLFERLQAVLARTEVKPIPKPARPQGQQRKQRRQYQGA